LIRAPVSGRERCGLHGPVKSIIDEFSTTAFDRDGKILEWSGNTSRGRVERKYVYDQAGGLVRISGSNGDQVDEFCYDERGRKTRIRRVPARSNRPAGYGIAAWFDCISEGDTLSDGGTVETTYNERDQPVEARILDDEGTVLFRIVYSYDADGRLSIEKLTTENPLLPKAFRDQIPLEHRAATLEQMKTQIAEISQRTGLYGDAERTYVYNEQGQLAERHMRMGPICEDIVRSYNDRGDVAEQTRGTSGFPHELGGQAEPQMQWRYPHEYDEHGNWKSRAESSRVGETETARIHVRQLTYHD
jgi:hypothetical protein